MYNAFLNKIEAEYSLFEAAVRWSDSLDQDLTLIGVSPDCRPALITDWQILRLNIERLCEAMSLKELPFLEVSVDAGEDTLLSVCRQSLRHDDLKRWMTSAFPAEKPFFLFEETGQPAHMRCLHQTTYALPEGTLDRSAQISSSNSAWGKGQSAIRSTAEMIDLNIIGSLLTLLLGHLPGGDRYSVFITLESVVRALVSLHQGRLGINEQALWIRFAQVKQHMCTETE
jgi:hypothetical protein